MVNGVSGLGQQLGRGLQFLQGARQLEDQGVQNQLAAQQLAAQQQQQAQLSGLQRQVVAGQQPVQPLGGQGPRLPVEQQQAQGAQALARLSIQFPDQFEEINQNLGLITQQQKDQAADFAFDLQNTPFEQRQAKIQQRARTLQAEGRNASDTLSLLELPADQQNQALQAAQVAALSPEKRLESVIGQPIPAGQQEFENLISGFSEQEKQAARRIKAGIAPRAVGSAAQTIAEAGTSEQVGESQAVIKEREEFASKTGASRAKAIDAGFERIGKIQTNISNIDRAIRAVEQGAGTGAIERRFPSLRAASVELDQIQGELALDVIGAVTFGALSEGELDLAKQIALPAGLEGPALIEHLQNRKAAQEKLRAYFQEQVDFLDRGGSVAGFLREKQRQAEAQPAQQGAQQQQPQRQQVGRFVIEVE